MKKVISKQYRQGDVLLVAIEQPFRTGKQIDLESGRVTLARGEIAAPNRVEPRASQAQQDARRRSKTPWTGAKT
jgi:hypothetical protein